MLGHVPIWVGTSGFFCPASVLVLALPVRPLNPLFSTQVCGNGVCEEAEFCSTCPADCGECPMTLQTKLAISLPLSLLSLGFVLTAVVRARRLTHV